MKKAIFLYIILSISACEKDLDYEDYSNRYVLEHMTFKCASTKTETYFSGKINGVECCFSHGIESYKKNYGIAFISITPANDPNYNTNIVPSFSSYSLSIFPPTRNNSFGHYAEYKPWLNFYTPHNNDLKLTAEEHLDMLKEGQIRLEDGYEFYIGWGADYLPGYNYYLNMPPGAVPQAIINLTPDLSCKKNKFELTKVDKRKMDGKIHYHFIFNIDCELNALVNGDPEHYGHLSGGILEYQLEIEE